MPVGEMLRIALLGDVFPGQRHPRMDSALRQLLDSCDAVVANLESPICPLRPKAHDKVRVSSSPGAARYLAAMGITHVSLANNHVFDQGPEGFESTRQELSEAGIESFGAGLNAHEAGQPILLEKAQITLGLIAATEERTQAVLAGPDTPGCACLIGRPWPERMEELRRDADHVVVVAHWGYCDFTYPDMQTVRLAEEILDAGAEAVVGHHSHIQHGYRRREDGHLAAYSLGNSFFDDYDFQGRSFKAKGDKLHGSVLVLGFDKDSMLSSEWFFTRQRGEEIILESREERLELLRRRSLPLRELEKYPRFWQNQVRRRMTLRALYWLNPGRWGQIRMATVKSLFVMLGQTKRNAL